MSTHGNEMTFPILRCTIYGRRQALEITALDAAIAADLGVPALA